MITALYQHEQAKCREHEFISYSIKKITKTEKYLTCYVTELNLHSFCRNISCYLKRLNNFYLLVYLPLCHIFMFNLAQYIYLKLLLIIELESTEWLTAIQTELTRNDNLPSGQYVH